jgi:hypothetical protein
MSHARTGVALICVALGGLPTTGTALTLDFAFGPGFAGRPAAITALQRAGTQWSSRLADPITVTVNVDFTDLGSRTIIGGASAVSLITRNGGYDFVRNQLVADAADEADDGIVASLPTATQFRAFVPAGFTLSGEVLATKANLKAMGYSGIDFDRLFGASDGTVVFNTAFGFDFDNRDGVGATLIDFETVAAHELGHIFGFGSIVDDIDALSSGAMPVMPLDLFRFNAASVPTSAALFATTARELRPGPSAVFSDVQAVLPLSTGVNAGDGRQASHFRDDAFVGVDYVGLMDPTLAFGTIQKVSESDLRVLDLIGYDAVAPVPVPPALWLMGGAVALLGARRRASAG